MCTTMENDILLVKVYRSDGSRIDANNQNQYPKIPSDNSDLYARMIYYGYSYMPYEFITNTDVLLMPMYETAIEGAKPIGLIPVRVFYCTLGTEFDMAKHPKSGYGTIDAPYTNLEYAIQQTEIFRCMVADATGALEEDCPFVIYLKVKTMTNTYGHSGGSIEAPYDSIIEFNVPGHDEGSEDFSVYSGELISLVDVDITYYKYLKHYSYEPDRYENYILNACYLKYVNIVATKDNPYLRDSNTSHGNVSLWDCRIQAINCDLHYSNLIGDIAISTQVKDPYTGKTVASTRTVGIYAKDISCIMLPVEDDTLYEVYCDRIRSHVEFNNDCTYAYGSSAIQGAQKVSISEYAVNCWFSKVSEIDSSGIDLINIKVDDIAECIISARSASSMRIQDIDNLHINIDARLEYSSIKCGNMEGRIGSAFDVTVEATNQSIGSWHTPIELWNTQAGVDNTVYIRNSAFKFTLVGTMTSGTDFIFNMKDDKVDIKESTLSVTNNVKINDPTGLHKVCLGSGILDKHSNSHDNVTIDSSSTGWDWSYTYEGENYT